MTKTKPEPVPPSRAADMERGGASGGGTRERKPHRRALRVSSHQPSPKTTQIKPTRNEAKEAQTKHAFKTSATAVRQGTSAGREGKSDGTKRSETGRGKVKVAEVCDALARKDSGIKDVSTESSSDMSDCASSENDVSNDAHSSEFGNGDAGVKVAEMKVADGGEGDLASVDTATLTPGLAHGERSISPGDQRSFASVDSRLNFSAAFSVLTGECVDAVREDLVRENEDLRSENEYLKDELEGLRSEMLEMRDVYMEEDIYQLQDLRQQLDQANKTCRILQYRLRKAERRSLRVAQTGQVDGELIRNLEQDVRVAKSVSLRLHSELEAVQKKSSHLEWENEELRERLQALEVAKQVLQSEMDKSRENSLKRRSLRSTASKSEKKLAPQDDSADLKCQLHFAKEESALMCKKLTKMAIDSESMREELAKYRLLYGDVDASQAAAGTANSTHTREAEVKVHLRLVEEEATLLSRRIVELEVENRGLRAEMSEMRERAGATQGEDDKSLEGGGERLASSVYVEEGEESNGFMNSGHIGLEERTNNHAPPRGLEGVGSEDCQLSQILREGPIGGERDPLEDQEKPVESAECNRKTHCDQGYSLSLKDIEMLIAIRDQAMLVHSTIQFLTSPAKNGLSPSYSHNFIPDSLYLSKTEVDSHCKAHPWVLDPMLSPLTSGLEVLQAQLRGLVAKVEDMMASAPTGNESNNLISESGEVKVEESHNQKAQQCPAEKITCNSSNAQENNCNKDSLELLTLQLCWFLQQWRQGERPTGECKSLFEVSSTHLSALRAALKDLSCELLEEYRAGQHVAQQFAQAKAAWVVECTELKSLVSMLEGSPGGVGSKGSADLKMALQKDHVEKLQHLLAESYAAVMDLTKQLKVCERNWTCERKELLKHLNQARNWDKKSSSSEKLQNGEETMRVTPKADPSTRNSNKNWVYLSQEAAVMDRDNPCKTWDCPIMPPSFPSLNLKQETALKSHTAPERTTLRIYYSPPSARRIHLSTVTIRDEDECEENQERQEPHCHNSLSEHINGDPSTVYDSWLGILPLECQSATEWHPFTSIRSSSSSGLQPLSISSPSGLPFSGLDVSSNMSDDMKEMTASVLQSSHLSPAEKRRGRDSGSHVIAVVSTGTQTHDQPQVNSVGLQTEAPRSVYAGRHWSPRVTSFVSGRTLPISTSLERIPGPSERPSSCSTSPKIQRRHSASSPFSSTSSSSNSNSSSSVTSSSLSSSSSLTASSRLETAKERSLFGLPQCSSGSTVWTQSSSTRPSSTSGGSSDKPAGRKNAGIHKYGLVQEFFRNVCGRGEKPNPGGEKAPAIRRDHAGSTKVKKTEGPPSRIPTMPLVRSDSVTKIVNRRFMKQNQKNDLGCGQTQTQSQCQNLANKPPINRDKGLGPVTVEDGTCDCSSRTLTSCFARASRTNLRHGHCKPRPHECPTAAGAKGHPLSQ